MRTKEKEMLGFVFCLVLFVSTIILYSGFFRSNQLAEQNDNYNRSFNQRLSLEYNRAKREMETLLQKSRDDTRKRCIWYYDRSKDEFWKDCWEDYWRNRCQDIFPSLESGIPSR